MKSQNFILIFLFAAATYWVFKSNRINSSKDKSLELVTPIKNQISIDENHPKMDTVIANKEKGESSTDRQKPSDAHLQKKQELLTSKDALNSAIPEYKEIFSGIDTKSLYLRGRSAEEVAKLNLNMQQYGGQSTEKFLTRLLDLRENDILSFEYETLVAEIKDEIKNSDNKQISYAGGKVFSYKSLSDAPFDIPVCKIFFIRPDENPSTIVRKFFVVGKSESFSLAPNIGGVRITRAIREDGSEKNQVIQKIECFVKSEFEGSSKYQHLNLLHLFATFNSKGYFIRPKKN